MKKIVEWIGRRGLLHIMACWSLCLTIGMFAGMGVAFSLTVVAGTLKDIVIDVLKNKGEGGVRDFACDIMGATIGLCIMLVASVL